MGAEENKVLVRRFVEEVQNQGRLDLLDALVAPDFHNHSAPPGLPADAAGVKQVLALFRTAFPDGRMTVEDMVAEGDKVVTRKTFRGTHLGPFLGMPPTGRPVEMQLIDCLRVSEGKVQEHWLQADDLGLLQQLGIIPAPK